MRAVAPAAASAFDPLIAETVLRGLTAPRKTLPPHLLYDPEGCRLFEAITTLPEYYVTRTELALLKRVGPELRAHVGRGASVVEYGAGSATKAALLLSALEAPAAYVPLDIAEGAVRASAREIRARFPGVAVHPQVCDFNGRIALPLLPAPLLGFFPGSTIGNLDTGAALDFLRAVRASLGQGARFLVGVDLPKSPDVLVPAYDDAAGVTAAFNMNLLHRLNREAAADFNLAGFAHQAVWNAAESRIEMHLRSLAAQTVSVAGESVRFEAGETIHTENSYKRAPEAFQAMAQETGWRSEAVWQDPEGLFSLHLLAA
ncbi:L-histidine N(alpha)-methyltransferase [Pseudoroseomonas rhizosphaerae]|uniref:L-histidine N(Alpha)-methyltransferase n=1 Tax=Teichococcus rhizosphaerae TaxID=1335062 RepID=A0A2C7AGA0_9PROT|nr:L-histidine N(alpha)-methyltransferase [Pseudoroseomonas rhizosphaerae]PHK96515.1 L-histidine N(alpha)-methyltransferase [Pseudoroseomonas rhizosphaerae]